METPRYAWLVLLAGVAATSFAAILVRLADESPALTTAAYRMLFAAVIVGGFAGVRVILGADRVPPRGVWPWLLLSGPRPRASCSHGADDDRPPSQPRPGEMTRCPC